MIAQYILPLLVWGTAVACAGERETFDFGWKFKYFGSGDPDEMGSPAKADSSQAGHEAHLAIDGNMSTRWCAADGKPGHSLSVRTGFQKKVKSIVIDWENDIPQKVTLTCAVPKEGTTGLVRVEKSFRKEGRQSVVKLGRVLNHVQVTVNGTGRRSWASIREITFLDEDGKAMKPTWVGSVENPARPDYRDKGFRRVQLPHDWAIESPFLKDEPNETGKLPWNGYGWYRKSFDVPADFSPEKERWFLDFDGVMSCPKVYVNGHLAGEWAYGYTSFRVDATPWLRPGRNLIAVRASNKPLSTRWYPGAGIYRHVWLEKTSPVHLARWGVFVTTPEISEKEAVVKVRTTVNNTGTEAATLTVRQEVEGVAASPVEVRVEAGASREVEQELRLPNPKLWSCETPRLYAVKTTVEQGGKSVDTRETTFGVRSIEWRPDGFFLNGKRVQLKGVCEHHDLGPLGTAFYERGFERKIEILRRMGCNSIRTSHNPPAPEALDLCDRYGILVIDELFDIWKHQKYDKVNGYHLFWPQWWKKDVRNFVLRDRNHPCIIAWSGGNEITEITSSDGPQISLELREEFRKYDTTRPYTAGVNAAVGAWNGFGDTLDVFGYNYKPSQYDEYSNRRPNMPFYASETVSCVATRGVYFFPLSWNINGGARAFQVSAYGLYAPGWAYCPDAEFTAQERNGKIAGEYVWTGFDYLGEPTPYNQDASNIGNFQGASEEEKAAAMAHLKAMGDKAPSRSSYFGIIDLAGFPKDTYYLYQSQWAPEVRQAHILPHWNWQGREGEKTPVMVFSSGDEAELFLNGVSQGVRRRGEGETFRQARVTVGKNAYRFTWEDVVYQPGELKVVVKKDGKPWATAQRSTTGKSVRVTAEVDRDSIIGDGRDLSYIELSVVDDKGREAPTDCRKVSFRVEGPAKLIGFCNGNPIDQTCMQDMNQSFFNGKIVAVLRGERGRSGKAVVTVKAAGLPEKKVMVMVKAATEEQLKK